MKSRITLHELLTGSRGQFLPSAVAEGVAGAGKAESIPGCQDQLLDVPVLPPGKALHAPSAFGGSKSLRTQQEGHSCGDNICAG